MVASAPVRLWAFYEIRDAGVVPCRRILRGELNTRIHGADERFRLARGVARREGAGYTLSHWSQTIWEHLAWCGRQASVSGAIDFDDEA